MLLGRVFSDFTPATDYFAALFGLVLTLHGIASADPAVADLRERLRQRG